MPYRKNRLDVQVKLSEKLVLALVTHYGRKPSATQFADDFNLRAEGTTTVSR